MQQRYARVPMMSHVDDDDLKVNVQKAPQGHVDHAVESRDQHIPHMHRPGEDSGMNKKKLEK